MDTSCSEIKSKYFEKTIDETLKKYPLYNIEEQYAIYICAIQNTEPPIMQFGLLLAMNGFKAVDYLETKLVETSEDLTVRDIIAVFEWMALKNTYNVSGNPKLLRKIDEKVKQMKNAEWKKITREMIDEIRKPSRRN